MDADRGDLFRAALNPPRERPYPLIGSLDLRFIIRCVFVALATFLVLYFVPG